MELTQEHFDEGLGNVLEKMATKDDIKAVRTDLKAQTVELKQYTTDAFATQQVWMDERFKELIIIYDVRDRVEKLEKEFREFKLHKPVHA
jgi:hypothetical protein